MGLYYIYIYTLIHLYIYIHCLGLSTYSVQAWPSGVRLSRRPLEVYFSQACYCSVLALYPSRLGQTIPSKACRRYIRAAWGKQFQAKRVGAISERHGANNSMQPWLIIRKQHTYIYTTLSVQAWPSVVRPSRRPMEVYFQSSLLLHPGR